MTAVEAIVAYGAKPVVLIVDEEPFAPAAARRVLGADYIVVAVRDDDEALALLARDSFDVIVCGDTPAAARDALLRRCAERHATVRRVVASSARGDHVDAWLHGGLVDAVIERPFDTDHVRAVLERVAPPVRGDALRLDRRVLARVPVEIAADTWPDGALLTTADISHGGAFCETADPLAVGTRIRLTCDAPTGMIEVEGRVAHVVSPERANALDVPAGIGIQFLDVPVAVQRSIGAWVDAHARLAGPTPVPARSPTPRPLTPRPSRPEDIVPPADVPALGRLLRAAARLRELPYHVRLGVALDAAPVEVETAYEARVRDFDERVFAGRSASVRRTAAEVRALLVEARAVLGDPARRETYAATIRRAAPVARAEEPRPRVQTPPELADLWDVPAQDAVSLIEKVVRARPGEPRFEALLETARARLELERGQPARALEHLRRAFEIDPRSREAAQFARRHTEHRLRDDRAFVTGAESIAN